jgi:hypothetical protein
MSCRRWLTEFLIWIVRLEPLARLVRLGVWTFAGAYPGSCPTSLSIHLVNAPTARRRGLRCNGLKPCSERSSAESRPTRGGLKLLGSKRGRYGPWRSRIDLGPGSHAAYFLGSCDRHGPADRGSAMSTGLQDRTTEVIRISPVNSE